MGKTILDKEIFCPVCNNVSKHRHSFEKEDLPPRLRKPNILKEIIYQELLNRWKRIQKHIIGNNLKVHKKWIEGEGFNCSLCIIDIEEGEIGIIYRRLKDSNRYRDNFSEEFKSLILGHSGKKNIGEIVQDKIKAKTILEKLSLGFLFINLPEDIKEKLSNEEIKITDNLKIKNFLDIKKIDKEILKKVISKYIPIERVEEISSKIMKEISDYINVVEELNLF